MFVGQVETSRIARIPMSSPNPNTENWIGQAGVLLSGTPCLSRSIVPLGGLINLGDERSPEP